MDPALRDLYEAELGHLRSHAREFAARDEFRALAERLGLSGGAAMRDPFVEWLLQGYAFLAARVRRKLDAEQSRFAEAVLSVVHPHLAAPTPAMMVAAFAMRPDPGLLATGALLPRGARLAMAAAAREGGARRPRRVAFLTGRAVRLWPVEVTAARYLPDAAAVAAAGGGRGAPAGVAMTLRATPAAASVSGLGADSLDLFCAGEDAAGDALFEALAFACAGCARAGAVDARTIAVAPLGLDRETGGDPTAEDRTDALLPYDARSFDGWRLLHEGLALPERFRFLRLSGLRAALGGAAGPEATLLFRLSRPFPALAGRLGPESLMANSAPAVNLFQM
jgi:type VI secretion system protein ImpG